VALIWLSCAWVAGIFLGSKFSLPPALISIGLAPIPLILIFRQYRKTIILAGLCIIVLLSGVSWFQSSLPTVDESSLQFYNDQQTAELKGVIARDPEVRARTTHLHLSATGIKSDGVWREVSGDALLFVPRYPAYAYGDGLLVTGRLDTPAQFDDFDYKGYLAHQGIYSTMTYPKIEVTGSGEGFEPLELVYSLRNRLARNLTTILPEPQASLAQGIVLGMRGTIPSPIKDNFSHTGTAHLLAISGLHLSIMAGILLSIGIWLFGKRRYIYVWLALGIIWLYALLTGMHPPVIRGTIMASLFLTAELLGRQRSAITALALAAAVMVGISPQILWDASFQLSFLAMVGLIFVTPPLMTLGRRAVNATLNEDGAAARIASIATDSFSVSLGAIIATWPVIAYYFGIVSLVGPLATFLTLPALPAIIVTGALAGGLGFIALPAAQAIGWITWLFTSYLMVVVNGFAAVPLSYIATGSIPLTLIWVYYPVLGITLRLGSRKKLTNPMPEATDQLKKGATGSFSSATRLPRKWALVPLAIAAIFVSVTAATMPDDNLHVSFLDVGEGDAILVQTPSHQDILVDGGPDPQAITLGLGRKMPFWDRTIDLVILTHPHADHLTGLIEVLRRYEVKQVLYPDLDSDSPLYEEWLSLIEEKNIKHTIARAGQQIDLGQGVIEVLNPPTSPLTDTQSDTDNNGVVLRLSMGEASFLLTADIMQEAEVELITSRASLSSTVLKAAHHGSDTSTCQQFLAVVNPQLAVISAGVDNKFDHPSPEVMERLTNKIGTENIYRTDERGTVELVTDGKVIWIKPDK